jgi:hypothetical protein
LWNVEEEEELELKVFAAFAYPKYSLQLLGVLGGKAR